MNISNWAKMTRRSREVKRRQLLQPQKSSFGLEKKSKDEDDSNEDESDDSDEGERLCLEEGDDVI